MLSICIYCPFVSTKLNYVLDFIFEDCTNIHYEIVHDKLEFDNEDAPLKISYDINQSENCINIPNSEFLKIGDAHFNREHSINFEEELTFKTEGFSFDFFAAIFYLLARVEEYDSKNLDTHGRYKYQNSVLSKKGLLQSPIIDYWIISFLEVIESENSISIERTNEYSFNSTIDIDHIYAFKGKAFNLKLGSTLKDLVQFNFNRIKDRWGGQKDPFDTYDQILAAHKALDINPLFFILTADRSTYDRSFASTHPLFKSVVSRLALNGRLGIHPSYASQSDKEKINDEKINLEHVVGRSIKKSRQHFLQIQWPKTYRALCKAHISEDYSMGYPDQIGFRAGTSRPFFWYDLKKDKVTHLRIFPFAIMDVTLKKYLNYAPKEALEHSKKIIDSIKFVNGQFALIWHNSSFYAAQGWGGWKETYHAILEYSKG